MAVMPGTDTTPDWMKSLLPDGGKVSITVHAAPSTTSTVDPNTGVTLQPGQTPVTSAMRTTTPTSYASPTTTVVNDPHGPGNTPSPPKSVPPPAPPPPNPGATVATGTGYKWWNPYRGVWENIPGIDAKGNVTDANAFWKYYGQYPAAALDAFASKLNASNNPAVWQHQYTPAELQNMVTGNADYITQLGGINNQRFQELLQFGDPSGFTGFGLTPAQLAAIRDNPASFLNLMKRRLQSDIYSGNAAAASHGAYSSGARRNDVANLQTQNVLDILKEKQGLGARMEGFNKEQTDLFKSIKDQMAAEGGFDPGDTEHNQKAYQDTHKVIANATKAGTDLVTHIGNIGKLKTVGDMRSAMSDIDKFLKQYGKIISPEQAAKLRQLKASIAKRAHDTVMARKKAAQRKPPPKKHRPHRGNPVPGGGMTGGIAGGGENY